MVFLLLPDAAECIEGMSTMPNSPQPRATVQLARCVPRSSTGLVPSTFKKAITDATSPDKWYVIKMYHLASIVENFLKT